MTFKDIDTVHERPTDTARKRFNDNKGHFIEGVDYFKICASEIRTHKIMDISPKAHEDIILLTLSGYLMIVKSFTDDLAWSVQRMLVNAYFCLQKKQSIERYASISKTDIIEYIKYFCEQYTENYLYLNKEINNFNRKVDRLIEENQKLRKENIKYKLILKKLHKKFL